MSATIGANISYRDSGGVLEQKIAKALSVGVNRKLIGQGSRDPGPTVTTRLGLRGTKNGIPASNTAADAPSGVNDICYDGANKAVYRCTAYVSNTSFTWTKIST